MIRVERDRQARIDFTQGPRECAFGRSLADQRIAGATVDVLGAPDTLSAWRLDHVRRFERAGFPKARLLANDTNDFRCCTAGRT